jgi:hypothetical protein
MRLTETTETGLSRDLLTKILGLPLSFSFPPRVFLKSHIL